MTTKSLVLDLHLLFLVSLMIVCLLEELKEMLPFSVNIWTIRNHRNDMGKKCVELKSSNSSLKLSRILDHVLKACTGRSSICSNKKNNFHKNKIQSQPLEEEESVNRSIFTTVLSNIFESLSSLRVYYVQFQQAHADSRLVNLQSAEDDIISEFETLCHIEQLYINKRKEDRGNTSSIAIGSSSASSSSLSTEIQECCDLVEEVRFEAGSKDAEILRLRWQLKELDVKNHRLEDEIENSFSLKEEILLSSYQDLTPEMFLSVYETTVSVIRDFVKTLFKLLKMCSHWDLDFAVHYIEPNTIYMSRNDKKFSFEAYITRKMYICDENGYMKFKNCNTICKEKDIDLLLMNFQDPFEALASHPDSNFAGFCRTKYLSIVHQAMEYAIFGDLDTRDAVAKWIHPRTNLYAAFVRMASWVWILQVMSTLVRPRPVMFHAKKGAKYIGEHMESVASHPNVVEVAFTVTPGFRIGDSLIKCKVYLSGEEDT